MPAGTLLELPSGVRVRGRPLRLASEEGDFVLVLGRGPAPPAGHRRVAWPDFWVPLDRSDALAALRETYGRARAGQRVDVACHGGVGRTGTALAALAVLDWLTAAEAVVWVRDRYHRRAVEAPWQRHWLRHVGSP